VVPARAAVTRSIEAQHRTAVEVVAPGEQILGVGGIGRDRIFIHRLAALRRLDIR
jgi:hypothetical protein